jgi:hypothetical protein
MEISLFSKVILYETIKGCGATTRDNKLFLKKVFLYSGCSLPCGKVEAAS